MRSHSRSRLILATLAVAGLALAGCGDDDGGGSGSGGGGGDGTSGGGGQGGEALAVCSDIPYEPFEFEGEGPRGLEYTGFDIDLLDAMAEETGRTLTVEVVPFDGIFGNLAGGSCDVVASAVTITDERKEEVDFTDPYFDADQSLLVKTDAGVEGLDDLAGETIGVQSGTTGEAYANDNSPEGATVRGYENADDLFGALEAGDIKAILQDLPVNVGRAQSDDSVEVVETFTTDEQYGFAVEKGNTELAGELNDALESLRDDGTYDEIYEKYFGSEG